MNNVILSGIDHEGQIFVHYETHGGGMGGPGLAVQEYLARIAT